jgi:hypothetical protein
MWVGNISHSTNILELRDLFSTGYKAEIRSIYWMAKSMCAFVNYSTIEACRSAISKFGNYTLRNNELKCRLRINPDADIENVSASRSQSLGSLGSSSFETTEPAAVSSPADVESSQSKDVKVSGTGDTQVTKDAPRYFIAKSLTTDDIKISVTTRLWTAQPHVGKTLLSALSVSIDELFIMSLSERS